MKKVWFVYILECSDGTLYTGITNNLKARLKAHSEGKGAKYTKGRGPCIIKFCFMHRNKSNALKHEIQIKAWSKKEKIKHIEYWSTANNRITLWEVIEILESNGWQTSWEVDNSNPGNDSTYTIWKKGNDEIYLGNYYLEGEEIGAFPWADPHVKKDNIVSLLNGDKNSAHNY